MTLTFDGRAERDEVAAMAGARARPLSGASPRAAVDAVPGWTARAQRAGSEVGSHREATER